jgi:hypothetical protein
LVAGLDSDRGSNWLADPAIKRSIPTPTQGAPYLLRMPLRDALRALLLNQAARGAGSQR